MSQIRQNEPYRFHYQGFYIDNTQCLGNGFYGEVYKANCDQLPCAAKILHNHPERDTIFRKIEQERVLLSNIRHPYIVQFLDITVHPETKLPVLLMELLDESLTTMLERSKQPLAYHIQVDICHDVALAVVYLHSENIVHRDLSSNNVLIIAGKRAKVTDFWMFGIDVTDAANAIPIMTSLSKQPNSLEYMPPEALREPPKYTKKLDCYSEGVIMMQICTLQSPKKAERMKHIEQITSTHPFLPIINKCLNTEEDDRPSAADVCDSLSKLKTTPEYGVSMQPSVRDTKEIVVISDSPQSSMIQKNEALTEQATEGQYPNNSLPVNKESKADQKSHSDSQSKAAEPKQSWHSGVPISPREMVRGAVALNGDEAYFMNKHGEIWLYDSTDQQPWSKVNNSYQKSRQYSSLVIVNGLLTLIGGLDDQGLANCISNTLLSLVGDDVDTKEWKEHFPPMSTARYFAAAVTTSQHLIVAGGIGEERLSRFLPKNAKKDVNLNNVEAMNTNTQIWSTVASLPHPYCKMSATICGDKLYLLGGEDTKAKTLSVLACSMTKLVESNKGTDGVWKKLNNDAPNFYCTCANLDGELIVVGGKSQSARNEVYKYSPERGTWKLITNAPTARYNCLVATFPSKNMVVVVGGREEKKLCTATEIWQCE